VTAEPRYLGHEKEYGRDLYLLTLDRIDTPYTLKNLVKQQFACLCAMDADALATDDIAAFCEGLLDVGCAYFCIWGADGGRVEDIMDEVLVGEDPPRTYRGCVMTTCHSGDSLGKAIWYFLYCTDPQTDYAPLGCAAGVIITVAGNEWISEIEQCILEELK
jgi:hypothetical protein